MKRPYSHSTTETKKMVSIRLDPSIKEVWRNINEILTNKGLPKKSQSEIIEEGSVLFLEKIKKELK